MSSIRKLYRTDILLARYSTIDTPSLLMHTLKSLISPISSCDLSLFQIEEEYGTIDTTGG